MDQAVRNGFNETIRQVRTFVVSLVTLVPDFIEKFSVHCEADSDREQLLNSIAAASYPPYAAAAQALGISVETMKKQIHRLSWGNARIHLLGTLEREGPELVAQLADIHGYEAWPGLSHFMRPETGSTKAPSVSPKPAAVVAEKANEVRESINSAPERARKAEDQLLEQWGLALLIARMLQDQEFANRVIAAYIHAPDVLKEFLLGRSIDLLGFSTRTHKCLRHGAGIDTIGQLVKQTEEDLLEIRNFGKRSLYEVRDKLAELELKLKEPPPLTS